MLWEHYGGIQLSPQGDRCTASGGSHKRGSYFVFEDEGQWSKEGREEFQVEGTQWTKRSVVPRKKTQVRNGRREGGSKKDGPMKAEIAHLPFVIKSCFSTREGALPMLVLP